MEHAAKLLDAGAVATKATNDLKAETEALGRWLGYAQWRGDLAAYQSFGGGAQIILPRLLIFDADGRPLTAFGRCMQFRTLRQVDRAVERAMAA